MEKGTHGSEEKTFENLCFADQARSINGQVRTLEKAIKAHLRRADEEERNTIETKNIIIDQVHRMG